MSLSFKTETSKDLISICICTFKRPKLLTNLLNSLIKLKTEDKFDYEIIIVDNDAAMSGKPPADDFINNNDVPTKYINESRQSISHARNKSVKNANGGFIAMIDDDEYPDEEWLLRHYIAINQYNAEGVLGPVKPVFDKQPPKWIIKSKICERETFYTGFNITNSRFTRTGNVLLKSKILTENEEPFDPKFGLIGGGDADFFKRMIKKGYRFVWCNEACVYEIVQPFRFKRSYYIKRAFTRGATSTGNGIFSLSTLKSIIASLFYIPALPFLFIIGHHLFMKFFIKTCDHLGKLLAHMGIKIVKKRPY
jgi:glycosyltransferase involved in cell wall biosynthesis